MSAWAGFYRTVDMSKGGALLCRAAYLEPESRHIFRELEHEQYLKAPDWTTEKFAERIAYCQSELIALHPYYELNGLSAYIEASILCVQRADSSKLQQILLQGSQRAESIE